MDFLDEVDFSAEAYVGYHAFGRGFVECFFYQTEVYMRDDMSV